MSRERGREDRGRWERKLENAKWMRSPDRNRDSNGDSYEDKDSDSEQAATGPGYLHSGDICLDITVCVTLYV